MVLLNNRFFNTFLTSFLSLLNKLTAKIYTTIHGRQSRDDARRLLLELLCAVYGEQYRLLRRHNYIRLRHCLLQSKLIVLNK